MPPRRVLARARVARLAENRLFGFLAQAFHLEMKTEAGRANLAGLVLSVGLLGLLSVTPAIDAFLVYTGHEPLDKTTSPTVIVIIFLSAMVLCVAMLIFAEMYVARATPQPTRDALGSAPPRRLEAPKRGHELPGHAADPGAMQAGQISKKKSTHRDKDHKKRRG